MRTRLSICVRKRHFASAADALAATAGLPLLPYRCDRCRQFHLTSRTKGKRVPRPQPRHSGEGRNPVASQAPIFEPET